MAYELPYVFLFSLHEKKNPEISILGIFSKISILGKIFPKISYPFLRKYFENAFFKKSGPITLSSSADEGQNAEFNFPSLPPSSQPIGVTTTVQATTSGVASPTVSMSPVGQMEIEELLLSRVTKFKTKATQAQNDSLSRTKKLLCMSEEGVKGEG